MTVSEDELGIVPPDPDASYYLRTVTLERARELAKPFTTQVPNPVTHQMEPRVDRVAVQDAIFDYALTDWVGVSGACTPENKKKLPADVITAILNWSQRGSAATPQSFRPTPSVRGVLDRSATEDALLPVCEPVRSRD